MYIFISVDNNSESPSNREVLRWSPNYQPSRKTRPERVWWHPLFFDREKLLNLGCSPPLLRCHCSPPPPRADGHCCVTPRRAARSRLLLPAVAALLRAAQHRSSARAQCSATRRRCVCIPTRHGRRGREGRSSVRHTAQEERRGP